MKRKKDKDDQPMLFTSIIEAYRFRRVNKLPDNVRPVRVASIGMYGLVAGSSVVEVATLDELRGVKP